jgi:hypothetical protein
MLATREWFSPRRWLVNDGLMALAAIVLGGSVLGPWFTATVKCKKAPLVGSLIVGSLIVPKGSESGIEAHRFLLAMGAIALVELAGGPLHGRASAKASLARSSSSLLAGASARSRHWALRSCRSPSRCRQCGIDRRAKARSPVSDHSAHGPERGTAPPPS